MNIFVKEKTPTEQEIERLYELRKCFDPITKEYYEINACIEQLLDIKAKEKRPKVGVSPDTWVKVAGGVILGGIIIFKEDLIGPIAGIGRALIPTAFKMLG